MKPRAEVFSTQRVTLGVIKTDGLFLEAAIPFDQNNWCATWGVVALYRSDGAKNETRKTGTDLTTCTLRMQAEDNDPGPNSGAPG